MARAPLVRPTDAPPRAHDQEPGGDEDQHPILRSREPAAPSDLPAHVAIIMDGNRRWARARGVSELEGHAAGVEAIRELLRHAVRRGVPVLTLYAFSRENWARTDEEVVGLFGLLEQAIRSETEELRAQGVQVRLLGRMEELPEATRTSIESALAATAGGSRLLLNVAFNYAGRTELVDAVRQIVREGIPADEIDEATIARALYTGGLPDPDLVIRTGGEHRPRALYTGGLPDPDLVIRTGGEHRLSNFLIWQSAYAELLTSETLWPDFGPADLDDALAQFASRTRRFGR